ncbi:reverse transcriptase domain-containing protein [Tanacetum coccineum]
MDKVQKPSLESTAQVPPPEEEESIFMEIPKPKAKKTVNIEIQEPNSPKPTSYQPKLPYPERMKVRENDKPSAQHSRFLKMFKQLRLEIGLKDALVEMPKFNKWTSALADSGASINLLPHSIYKQLGLEALTPTRMTLELANHPRVPIILGRPFLRTAKALIDLYEETLTLRVGKEELVYYADKSEKNEEKKFVHAISIIDFSKDDPFSGITTIPSDAPFPSSSPMKTSDQLFVEFINEFTLPNSLPPGDDIMKRIVEIKSSSSFTLTSPEESELEAYLERDSIPPGIDLNLPPTLEVSSSNPTSPTLTGEKKPKPLSRPQEVDDIKMKDDKVSSQIPIDTIVMPIRITFDNPINFNDHFSKPKDLKTDFTVAFDSTESSILPPPLLDSDSPFTAELSASVTLNSLGNEDKVFKPGILVYHTIHDKNLATLEKNLRENISSGTLLFLKEPSSEPPDVCMRFKPILAIKNDFVKPYEDFYLSETMLSLNVEDVDSFTFIIWTFLPYFTYPEDSPLIFSFRSKNFVFDPGISTFHFSFKASSIYFP